MSDKTEPSFAIGVDYGTNSVRALVVDCASGEEVAMAVYHYPSGEAGILLDARDPQLARQYPGDYIEGFIKSVSQAVQQARAIEGFSPERVVGIGVDTTGSTPMPIDEQGVPLAMHDQLKDDLAAHAWLWKDHTSHAEAAEITERAKQRGEPYLAKCGGTYSSEWFWSKILHCKRTSPRVFEAAYSWVELADFVPAYVTGNTKPAHIRRGVCAAGHKAMYHPSWGGLPSEDFLASLDPDLAELRGRLYRKVYTADQQAGGLTERIAAQVKLPAGIAVAVGAFDAHTGAVGAGIRPGTLVKTIGTSTCDTMVVPEDTTLADIPGLCGIVPGSILPGMYGLEAGQSAVGDIFNWFVNQLAPAKYTQHGDTHAVLTRDAAALKPGESGLLALDWHNGNRTVLVDPMLTGLMVGQTLHTTAPEIYRALVEATAFGALTIIQRLEEYGVTVEQVINCGGIAEKNAFVMQVYADVCDRPMKVSRSAQTCALGAAIGGAVAGGRYANMPEAQQAMTGVREHVFRPNADAAQTYRQLYALYRSLHDAFGQGSEDQRLGRVMKDLLAIRERVRKG